MSDSAARVLDLAVRLGYLSAPDAKAVAGDLRDDRDAIRALSSLGLLSTGHADRLREALQGLSAPEEPPQALPAPFGEYVLLEVLGRGGMGIVYRARQEALKRDVAIKLLTEDSGALAIARLRREAQVSAGLSHPNIAAVYEVGDHEGTPFIAMQLVRGHTLSRLPRRDPRTIARLVRDAAVGVHHAHEHGFVHRDLKPDNLMVENDRVFVMDFGLAREADQGETAGAVAGTPVFMPPEQTRGAPTDARGDVYSLGATLYDLLAGRPPFLGRTLREIFESIREQPPQSIRTIQPRIDPELDAIVLKCLAKEPRSRYPTAKALADDLGRWLAGEFVEARPPSTMERLRRGGRRRKGILAAAAAGLLCVATVAAFLVPRWRAERDRRQKAEADRLRAESLAGEQAAAARAYKEAEIELHTLRMRSYRAGWKLVDEDFRKFEAMIARCRDQMARTGRSADGHWVIGRARQALGDSIAAVDEYDRGLEIDPTHGRCLLSKAQILLEDALFLSFSESAGRTDADEASLLAREAEGLVERGLATGGVDEIDQDLTRGYRLVVRKEPVADFCAAMLEKYREGSDFRDEFLLLRGLGDGRGLEEAVGELLKARPSYGPALLWRASARLSRGDKEGAVSDQTAALEINPRDVRTLHERGILQGERGNPDAAIADLSRAIALQPRYAAAYAHRAMARQNKHDLDGALADVTEALRVRPTYASAYVIRGTVHLDRGDPDTAIADFDTALTLNPRSAYAYYNRGNARKRKRDADGAMLDYTRAIEFRPRFKQAYFNRAMLFQERRERTRAMDDLTKAIQIDPRYAAAYSNRAMIRLEMSDPKGALVDYDEAARLEPTVARHFYNRASVRDAAKDLDGAIRDYTEAIRLQPNFAEAYNNRGSVRRRKGDLSDALADCTKAIELRTPYPEAYANRATVHWSLAEREPAERIAHLRRARADFEEALRSAPENWPWRKNVDRDLRQIRQSLGE